MRRRKRMRVQLLDVCRSRLTMHNSRSSTCKRTLTRGRTVVRHTGSSERTCCGVVSTLFVIGAARLASAVCTHGHITADDVPA